MKKQNKCKKKQKLHIYLSYKIIHVVYTIKCTYRLFFKYKSTIKAVKNGRNHEKGTITVFHITVHRIRN